LKQKQKHNKLLSNVALNCAVRQYKQVARKMGKTPESVRETNLYAEGEVCHFGQVMESSQLRACWDQATGKARYHPCHLV